MENYLSRVAPFAVPQGYNTELSPLQEMQFRGWLKENGVPFDAEAGVTDYDMRGYWRGRQQGNPQALPTEINPNDNRPHYPDYYKTPLHKTFSSGSQWAQPGAPQWTGDSVLAAPSGRIIHDERTGSANDFESKLRAQLEQLLRK